MSTSKAIVWIDDNPGRQHTAEDLGARFVDVRNADLAVEVENLLRGRQPRLVILDHILDKTATTNPLFKRGSTIAEAIKEQWPACPVVGVTNIDKIEEIDLRTRLTYDALFPYYNFAKYLDRIESISKGFALISRKNPASATGIVQLLKPPNEDIDRLVAALPDHLKESPLDASVASRLYRWVEHLMSRPGFLYDNLGAATLLGLSEAGFEKVVKQFSNGQYSGIFAAPNDPRWWSSRLTELLYRTCKPRPGEFSWHVGRRLPSIKKEHFSRCYRCGEEFPDTVAYLDSESEQRRAMHLACTVLHPGFKRELYFEDIRMMRGD